MNEETSAKAIVALATEWLKGHFAPLWQPFGVLTKWHGRAAFCSFVKDDTEETEMFDEASENFADFGPFPLLLPFPFPLPLPLLFPEPAMEAASRMALGS